MLLKSLAFQSSLRSNIVKPASMNYQPISVGFVTSNQGSTNTSSTLDLKQLTTFYRIIDNLKSFEYSNMSKTITELFESYILKSLIDTKNPFEYLNEEFKPYEEEVNKIFNDLEIYKELTESLKSIVYYGSKSIKISYNKSQNKLIKENLVDPYNVVSIDTPDASGYLVKSRGGSIAVFNHLAIIKFSINSLHLHNDMSILDRDEFIDNYSLIGSEPLFYGISDKIKEYLIKDRLMSVIALKELLMPLILTLKLTRSTPEDDAAKLAQKIQSKLNGLIDESAFLSGTFNIEQYISAALNNIEVIPDYDSSAENLGTLDLDKLMDKIQNIRNEQDVLEDSILNATSVPSDLFKGSTNAQDAIRQSEKLNLKVAGFISNIKLSVKEAIQKLTYLRLGKSIPLTDIQLNMFRKNIIEYNDIQQNLEFITNLFQSIKGLIDDTDSLINSDNKLINKKRVVEFIKSVIQQIDPNIDIMLSDENLHKVIDNLSKSNINKFDDY